MISQHFPWLHRFAPNTDDELEELLNDDMAPFHEGLNLPEEPR